MMKHLLKISLLAYLALLLISCEESERSLEKKVMAEVFNDLVDSLAVDRRLVHLLNQYPFGKPIYDSNGKFLYSDSTEVLQVRIEHDKKVVLLKKDTLNLRVAVGDSTFSLGNDDVEAFKEHYKIEIDTSRFKSYKLDIHKYYDGGKFKFKYLSEFPNRDTIWTTPYNFNLACILNFSEIKFDTSKSKAVMSVVSGLGRLDGISVRVFMSKKNGKWSIDEMITTGVS